MSSEVESDLSKEALRRKERLAEMRAKHSKPNDDEGNKSGSSNNDNQALPKPVFRSYKPIDESLKAAQRENPDLVQPEEQVPDQLAAAKSETLAKEVDVTTLAPRKPDWDLKRDVAPLLDKLERRTQRAIAEIIRERLQAEKSSNNRDWAEAVAAGADAERQSVYDS